MQILYEKASLQDIGEIVKMQHKLNNMLGLYEDIDDECLKDYLNQSMVSEEITYYIARQGKEVIGVICLDFSDCIVVENIEYAASIPLIYVDEKYRCGQIAYNLFKLGLQDIIKRGLNSAVMTIENNNPNKYLHFAIADRIIEEREELLKNGNTIKQYLLGISDVNVINNLTFKDCMKRVVYTKNNFNKVINQMVIVENFNYM